MAAIFLRAYEHFGLLLLVSPGRGGAPPDLAFVRDRISRRVGRSPRLRQRLLQTSAGHRTTGVGRRCGVRHRPPRRCVPGRRPSACRRAARRRAARRRPPRPTHPRRASPRRRRRLRTRARHDPAAVGPDGSRHARRRPVGVVDPRPPRTCERDDRAGSVCARPVRTSSPTHPLLMRTQPHGAPVGARASADCWRMPCATGQRTGRRSVSAATRTCHTRRTDRAPRSATRGAPTRVSLACMPPLRC